MSVLACNRKGCENVMCDHCSPARYGYICNDCLNELVALGETNIQEFMDSPKNRNNPPTQDWEHYVRNIVFPNQYDEEWC